jgi:SAM-dependent methyltransferase
VPTTDDLPVEHRPRLDERATYVPRARVEKFIVTLLAAAIPEAMEKWAVAGPGAKALDVGCGRQPFRSLLESRGFGYTGLDTQQNADGSVAFVAPIDGELPAALRDSGPFEFILCTEVLEHVADWAAAWRNLVDLLAPGGRLLITCPFVYPLHEEPFDFWRPTAHALRFFGARHGLRILEQRQLGDGWEVVATAAMASSPRVAKGTLNPLAYVLAARVRIRRKILFWAAGQAWLRRWVPAPGRMYLCNLIVLEKPA